MKIMIITVAGMSTRFSRSVGRECLKCIYYEENIEQSLLYKLVHLSDTFDKFVIVGGFQYAELVKAVEQHFTDLKDKIIMVENPRYGEAGSGYSLFLGLQKALEFPFEELVFAEGDLFLDGETFGEILQTKNNVITFNNDPIWANKAVAFYFDKDFYVHYIYDGSHNALAIKEEFLGIFNSGQVWKFYEPDRVRESVSSIKEPEWDGTNLVFIQKYFGMLERTEYELLGFKQWINCNTVEDFKKM